MSPSRLFLLAALLAAPATALAQVDMDAPPSDASPSDAPQASAPQSTQRDTLATMFDNFAISGVVAGLCKPPDEALMGRFVANFSVVQSMMIRRIRTQMPDKPVNEIGDMLQTRMRNLNQVATTAVQTKGCTDPEIVQLVDMFAVNASMDLAKRK